MRIAYILNRRVPSRETDTQQMVKTIDALSRNGAQVDLIAPLCWERAFAGAAKREQELRDFYRVEGPFGVRFVPGVQPTKLDFHRPGHGLLGTLSTIGGGYDVIYTRSSTGVLAALTAGQRVVYETYRKLGSEQPRLIQMLSAAARSPRFLGIFTHSAVSRDDLAAAGFPAEKLAVVYNGFDLTEVEPRLSRAEARAALGEDPERPVACYTGHVRYNKGMDALLDLAERVPELELWLAGGQEAHLRELEADIRTRGLKNMRLLGWKPARELPRLMYAADLLIIPPSAKPLAVFGRTVLPMKTFTYLAAGRPILAPDTADLREVLHDRENARLVRPDAPDEAANAVREILEDPAFAARLGSQAATDAQGYSWDSRARRVLEMLERWTQSSTRA